MGSFSGYIPPPKQEREAFLVKGLRLPLHDSESCLAQLIGNYFSARENFVVFTSFFGGKATAIKEIVRSLDNSIVFSNGHQDLGGMAFSPGLLEGRSSAIFYNVPIPFAEIDMERIHVCGFYDYDLSPLDDYRDFIAEFTAGFPQSFQYTVICKEPARKRVEFMFGTTTSVKHICMRQLGIGPVEAFSKEPVSFKMDNVRFIHRLDDASKARQFVFYDLDPLLVPSALKQFDTVVFIFTKEDFTILRGIAEAVEKCGLEVPEPIKRISSGGTH